MDKLEEWKITYKHCQEINDELLGIAYVEDYALQKFKIAHAKDMKSDFGQYVNKILLSLLELLLNCFY